MIRSDEDALICDLAETYHIFNYKELPPKLVAILSVGLRENSRIKMSIANARIDVNQVFLASILDCLKTLVWLNSSDGSKGINRPTSTLEKLLGKENESRSFVSSTEFEEEREKIIKRINERR